MYLFFKFKEHHPTPLPAPIARVGRAGLSNPAVAFAEKAIDVREK